jgi:N-acetylglutamate synthase-like GNAT family acetyltransferase
MRVRKVRGEEAGRAVELARKLELDYPEMERDTLWIAEEEGRVAGVVALKAHPDCLELCSLGVDPAYRGRGIAKALVEALMAEAPRDVHLATVIPGFFKACGFHIIRREIPAAFPAKRQTVWCEGCPQERCAVMRRRKP